MYHTAGTLFGAEIQTGVENGAYCVRIEDTPLTRSLVQETGIHAIHVEPHQDSGRPWWLIPYSSDLDELIVEAVDALIDTRRHQPDFGQVRMML